VEIASVNADTKVDSTDMLLVAQNFGYGPRAVLDVNKDGKINSTDMLIVVRNFHPVPC
jgi:hypothetical protein